MAQDRYPILSCVLGLFFGFFVVLFGVMVYAVISMMDHEVRLLGDESLFYRYQTLITGLLALIGARLTVRAIRAQITQVELQAVEDRKRKSTAARAAMPLSLDRIMDYAKVCGNHALSLNSQNDKESPGTAPKIPKLSASVISNLRECIEHADNGLDGPIADLLHDVQLVRARLQDSLDETFGFEGNPVYWDTSERGGERLFDAAQLYARASNLLPYARRQTDEAPKPITLLGVCTAFKNMTFFKEISDEVDQAFCKTVKLSYPKDQWPENWI